MHQKIIHDKLKVVSVVNEITTLEKQKPARAMSMRHGVRTKRLGRPADQRKAIIRSLVTQVLTHGTIKTTATRARYIRKYIDKMITLSKKGNLNSRRIMEKYIYNKALISSIMVEAPERYADRYGGYCRVSVEPRLRRGDAALMATVELV
jgi:large subunit ribosomal protein L17